LIVGGTGGIGSATARRFLREGARVVVTGLTADEGREALEELRPLGQVWALSADVTDPEAVERLFQKALSLLGGRLDVMVHTAGISGRKLGDGPLHECSHAAWDAVLAANARGTFLSNQAAVKRMLAQALDGTGLRGTVLNVGSVLDRAPAPEFFGTVAYAASKGAVRALTRAAAARYALERIRFNLLVPSLIDTPMARRAIGDPATLAYLATKQPLAAGPGTVADCAEAALYLCEPASRFVTGSELLVDGGWCIAEGFARAASASAASPAPAPAPGEAEPVVNPARASSPGSAPGPGLAAEPGHWPWPEIDDWSEPPPQT
jgi:NAD(P)-dependent dehydrogenase (short-subunit alcohol dehydrogenase family)